MLMEPVSGSSLSGNRSSGSDAAGSSVKTDIAVGPIPHTPVRILLVEDDPVMQLGLEQFFEEYPQYEIVGQAMDGYSGVEIAQQLQPDLVIMDIGLPKLDGIAATQQIRSQFPGIRIIMLTSHTADHEILAALSSGADAYCVKGVNLDHLTVAITSVQEGAIYLDAQIARRVLNQLRPVPSDPQGRLSNRELEVLKLIVEGKSNPEIATLLYLSLSTVKCHVRSIMEKLAVDDRVQAAVVALRSGLI